jgi:peptide/nickel transport system substrate-binding protein
VRLTGILAAAAVVALPIGMAPAQSAGTLRISLNADIRSTNFVNRDANTDAVMLHTVEGLVAFREDGSVGMALAEKLDVSPEGMTYTFRLRPGVRFHNGATVTAEDVVWSWKRWLDPATQWRCLPEFDGRGAIKVVSVEAADPQTVVFNFEKPSALVLAQMARADCGMSAVLHKDSLDAEGKWKAPVGTGPFKLGEWKKGEYVELVRFPDYVSRPGPRDGYSGGKHALVERVRFVVIPDPSAAKAALLSGALDILTDLSTEDAAELRQRADVVVESSPTMGLSAILFQTKDPLLKDVRIRQAIAHSIDTAEIVGALTQGHAKPNNSPIPVSSPFHKGAQTKLIKRDIAMAKKLLAEAGYRGQPIKMIANKRYTATFDAAVLVQAMAGEAGIKIELEVLDWATQLDKYTKGDYQTMSFTYSARLDPALSFEMMSGPKATQPRKVWDNADGLKVLHEAMAVSDTPKRQALFDDLYARWLADMPAIVLYNGIESAGIRKNVRGYKPFPMGLARAWDVSLN